MSWTASAWAKKTRGHRGHGCGRLLLVLADYHNDEDKIAWPSQRTLSQDCEMPKRTVQWCLAMLEKQGFITTLQKGNQYKPTKYRLNFNVMTPLDDQRGKSEGVKIASASEDAKGDKVKAQDGAREGAMARHDSLQEPPIEPPVPPFSSLRSKNGGRATSNGSKSARNLTDPRVSQVMMWLKAERGYVAPRRAAEIEAIRRMLDRGYSPEQIQKVFLTLQAEPFYLDKEVWMMTVEGQIGPKLNGRAPAGAVRSSRPPADRRVKQEEAIRQAHPQRLPEYR